MDPTLYKDLKVSRGFVYHYFYAPASPGYPTLLFIHGFPSSSYDWHRQVKYFRPKGYGLLVPDTLGSGGTSKPEDPEAFRFALSARDIVDVLDAEGLDKVVGIAHDWGSALLSRLANLFAERFYAFAWIAIGYNPPRPHALDVDGLLTYLEAKTGNSHYGYWKHFSEDDAHRKYEQNIDSFLHLIYPKSPEVWLEWLTPVGKARQWIEENRTTDLPEWLTQEEYNHFRSTLLNGSLKSTFNYYKAAVRSVNAQDDKKIPEEAWTVRKPALFVAALHDAVGTLAVGLPNIEKYVPHAKVVRIDAGHWVQLEATERLNEELRIWIEGLGLHSVKQNL
ncbi:alpha/beta-hydrolase [Trametes elegans]|nr:alpha/beta-hydrolase [Trametes elegans]